MRGHEALVAMRLGRYVPPMVFVETDADPNSWHANWQPGDDCAHLLIEPHEALHALDLRCVVGLVVNVAGTNAERVEAVVKACVNADAKRVIGAVFAPDFRDLKVVAMSDTEGVMTCQM